MIRCRRSGFANISFSVFLAASAAITSSGEDVFAEEFLHAGQLGERGLILEAFCSEDGTWDHVWKIASGGDFNGDGFDDIVVHVHLGCEDTSVRPRVIFGRPRLTGRVRVDLDVANSLTFENSAGGEFFASPAVEFVKDVDGDGFDELMLGYSVVDGERGVAYLLFGHEDPPDRLDVAEVEGTQM